MPTYRDDEVRVTLMERCKELRSGAKHAEALPWSLLRNRQVAGAKFRRQHQFGRYILDFYCPAAKLAIEVDGAHHFESDVKAADLTRSHYIETRGISVLRFANSHVLQSTEQVVTEIQAAVTLTPALSQKEREVGIDNCDTEC